MITPEELKVLKIVDKYPRFFDLYDALNGDTILFRQIQGKYFIRKVNREVCYELNFQAKIILAANK
jgi:hypothetical protein